LRLFYYTSDLERPISNHRSICINYRVKLYSKSWPQFEFTLDDHTKSNFQWGDVKCLQVAKKHGEEYIIYVIFGFFELDCVSIKYRWGRWKVTEINDDHTSTCCHPIVSLLIKFLFPTFPSHIYIHRPSPSSRSFLSVFLSAMWR
jgi:hypothetical protein